MFDKTEVNASLIFRELGELKHVILLPGEEVTFGRDVNNDIRLALFPLQDIIFQLATADISRHHFVIRHQEGGYTIQDMKSTNGTSVDCIAVLKKERPLKDGQIIDIGGVLDLRVSLKGEQLRLDRITNTSQESYVFFRKEMVIGSAPDSVLAFFHPDVVLNHIKIRYENKRYALSKIDQENRVTVNGKPLEGETWMEDKMHINLGTFEILFKLQQD